MQLRVQITSFSAKKTYSFLPKIQRDSLSCLWFCQYFPQSGNKLQRFCSLLCSVRITACLAGFVLRLRLPCGWCLDYPTASSSLVFEVSCKLPGWWRVWRKSLTRSGWGNWGCVVWRRGGWRGTLLLSTTTWKEAVVRRVLVSSPRQLAIGQEIMASSCVRGGLD